MKVTRLIVATPETQQVTGWFGSSGIQVEPSSKSVMRPLPEIIMAMADGVVDDGHSAALGFQPERGDLTVLRIFGNDLGDISRCAAAYARKYGKTLSARPRRHGPDPDLLLGMYEDVEDEKATLSDESSTAPSLSQSISHFANSLVSRCLSVDSSEDSQRPIPAITGNILIVHSHSSVRALWTTVLKERGGHEVESTGSGTEALDLMERNRFDLVLAHLRLADMCPFRLINTVKQRSEWQDTRFAFLTHCTSDQARQLGVALGADGYRAPPVRIHEMRTYIGELLSRKPTPGDLPRAIALLREFSGELGQAAAPFLVDAPDISMVNGRDASASCDTLQELPAGIDLRQVVECLLDQVQIFGRKLHRIAGADEILDPSYWLLGEGAGRPENG